MEQEQIEAQIEFEEIESEDSLVEQQLTDVKRLQEELTKLRTLFVEYAEMFEIQGEGITEAETSIEIADKDIVIATQNLKDNYQINIKMNKKRLAILVLSATTGAALAGPVGFMIGTKIGLISMATGGTIGLGSALLGFNV